MTFKGVNVTRICGMNWFKKLYKIGNLGKILINNNYVFPTLEILQIDLEPSHGHSKRYDQIVVQNDKMSNLIYFTFHT